MKYDQSIDRIRGFLVLIMVYAHMLQFFGDAGTHPAIAPIIDMINVLVFPTFVFCFGRSAAIAYLQKPFLQAAPRLVKMTLTLYGVYALSGIGYRVLAKGAPFSIVTVERVLLLKDIPGWSEFLAAFAAYSFVVLVLHTPLKWLSRRFGLTLGVMAACLACCFLPYGAVASKQLGLFIGTDRFTCFPVVQYAPYLLAGIYWQENRWHGKSLAAIGLAASLAGIVYTLLKGLPGRFPPTLFWVLLPGLFPAAMSFWTARISSLPKMLLPADGWLRNVGRRSLYYLLTSNLMIFALSGLHAAPLATKRDNWFWQQPITSPWGALLWTAVLFGALWLISYLAGRASAGQGAEAAKAAAS